MVIARQVVSGAVLMPFHTIINDNFLILKIYQVILKDRNINYLSTYKYIYFYNKIIML